MKHVISDLRFQQRSNMNARLLDNNWRGRNSGKGNLPAVIYPDHSTDLDAYVGMAEHINQGFYIWR